MLSQAAQRVTGAGTGDLGVDLHRDGNLAVPQDLYSDARVCIERSEQRSTGAPGVVDLDVADASLLASQSKVAGEVPRFIGRAVGGGEYQPGFLPGVTGRGPVAALPLGPARRKYSPKAGTETTVRTPSLGAASHAHRLRLQATRSVALLLSDRVARVPSCVCKPIPQ
jgi:hypothetical protein